MSRFSDTLDVYLDADKMEALDLIVPIWTMGTITREQEKGLLDAVKGGVGIAGWHGGMGDSFRNNTEYQWMVGGQWVSHPDGVMRLRRQHHQSHRPDHARPERLQDALRAVLHARRSVERGAGDHDLPLARLRRGSRARVMPVVWKRMWGKGRVFYSSLGHVAKDFDVPEAKEIQIRGMLWASK